MKKTARILALTLFSAYALLWTPAANAAPHSPDGHASQAAPDREFRLQQGSVMHLNVKRFETIRITDGEKTVTWTFDTIGTPNFPLSRIFPGATGFVYVDESPLYAY